MKPCKILIADDDLASRENLLELLQEEGYEVKAVADGHQALEAVLAEPVDLLITDLHMPGMNGLELIKLVQKIHPPCVPIVITGYGTINSAVEAMKLGAFDYITKPLRNDLVKLSAARALAYLRLQEENSVLKEQIKEKYDFTNLIGYSECMRAIFDKITKVSASDSTVIIYGESGTGKELVAKAIHFNSDRKDRTLVAVNCGAIPEELLEAELFGHEKGAFTGAIRNRVGRFELAEGGTIFLDEVGDMSPTLQVKVLRVIQERQFERIGGVKTINADVRIITATNQNLEKAVAEKRFREDLFYRINVIPLHLPPLRERGIDIPILVNHFLAKYNLLKKKDVKKIVPEAMNILRQYSWPGNVRELQNLIEMLVVMKEDGTIEVADLPVKMQGALGQQRTNFVTAAIAGDTIDFNRAVENFEKDLIGRALEKSGGVKNKAARMLNLNRTTLVEKLKRLNMPTMADLPEHQERNEG
jgi:DNA-binding NtrC family response regulator